MNLEQLTKSINGQGSWTERSESLLRAPYKYLVENKGKQLRKVMVQCFNQLLRVPEEKITIIEQIIDILHSASLMIDDIEDNATLRRGKPASHTLFGVPFTINSANYMYFVALAHAENLSFGAIEIFTQELMNLHRGQGMELHWRDQLQIPTENEYIDMVIGKTGGLFRLAIRLMVNESDGNYDLIPLANIIGVIYQVRDDYMNLSSDAYKDNKGFCEDITEGKFSFPIIHSIRADLDNQELLNILKLRTQDVELKKYAIEIMQRTGSFEYCKDVLAMLHKQAIEMMEKLPSKETVLSLKSILRNLMV